MKALLLSAALAVGCWTVPLEAQAARESFTNGQFGAVIWNRSACTLSIQRATSNMPPNTSGFVTLNHSLLDYVESDGSMSQTASRNLLVDGRVTARVNAASHLEVRVAGDCSLSYEQLSKAQLLENAETRVRYAEYMQREDRRSTILGVAIAGLAFGAAAYFAGSDSEDAETYSLVGVGAGVGMLFGTLSMRTFTADDRADLERDRRVRDKIKELY